MSIDFEALKKHPEDSMYRAGWNEAIEKVQAMLAEQQPFGWFYELYDQNNPTIGGIFLGCSGDKAEDTAKRARSEGDGPAFPLYAGKEGVPLSTMPELQAAVKAGLEDGSIEITGAA